MAPKRRSLSGLAPEQEVAPPPHYNIDGSDASVPVQAQNDTHNTAVNSALDIMRDRMPGGAGKESERLHNNII